MAAVPAAEPRRRRRGWLRWLLIAPAALAALAVVAAGVAAAFLDLDAQKPRVAAAVERAVRARYQRIERN